MKAVWFSCFAVACAAHSPPREPARWQVPPGFRSEQIPFPLDFAPSLAHRGVEELRFAPGFFDPKAPGYWAYAFAWRLDDSATFDAPTVAAELTTYFRGLVAAVDDQHDVDDAARATIAAHAEPGAAPQLALTAHVIDGFKTKQPVELRGTATRHACRTGSVWVFVLAPDASAARAQLDQLATLAACDQSPIPNAPHPGSAKAP